MAIASSPVESAGEPVPFGPVFVEKGDRTFEALHDLVVYLRLDQRRVLLLTVTGVPDRPWRARRVRLPNTKWKAEQLSSRGTKLWLVGDDRSAIAMDLTLPDRESTLERPHMLPMDHLMFVYGDSIVERNDTASWTESIRRSPCGEGARLTTRLRSGELLCLSSDNALILENAPEAAYRVGTVADGMRWIPFEDLGANSKIHLIGQGARNTVSHTVLTNAKELVEIATTLTATQLYLSLHAEVNGTTLATSELQRLSGELDAEVERFLSDNEKADASKYMFRRIVPDAYLYAPVLSLARDEPVYPIGVDYWSLIGSKRRATDQDWWNSLDLYQQQPNWLRKRCIIYARVRSFPGSWLFEYWLYFPFDVGGVGSHLHDSEHVFIEVDKLGGRIHQVLASAHGRTTSNNIYEAYHLDAVPVRLPVHVLVERGKHALAPDINKDGVITPGYDINTESERALVWGIRDVIGIVDNQFLRFEPSMTLPRQRSHRLASSEFGSYYPTAATDEESGPEVVEENCDCELMPFPAIPSHRVSSPRDWPTEIAAISELVDNEDAKEPRRMFKDWVFPKEAHWRVGMGTDGSNGVTLSVGPVYGSGLFFQAMTFGKWRPTIPGRFVLLEVSLAKTPRSFVCDETTSGAYVGCVVTSRRWDVAGTTILRYERLVSNLFGVFSGLNFERGDDYVEGPLRISKPGAGLSYSVGQMFEWPDSWPLRTNTNVQVGVTLRTGYSPRVDVKVYTGFLKVISSRFGVYRHNAANF